MYYDIFFSNPQGEIVREPDADQRKLINEFGPGVLIQFPGSNYAVVYAVKDFGAKRFHCLVTEKQLDKIEADNVPFLPFSAAGAVFKAQPQPATEDNPSPKTEPWHGKAPAHVFNPDGVVSRKGGKNYIHRVARETEEELVTEE